ncbi:carbohydrate kinase family protein [Streptomyces sp. NBC_00503]|uniref:carbohydrate kinase family protein n=1 Tax=Streptomyces sp. NBC_00503 TaxID=2903659 RepID=UPI002E80895F|nr:carbohydrate kinase family protein [Streptomyces sp. NBC_00503]WUD86364.1 carbohydrate kinase family protein [Streptomyces sp. NBC_00503]
MRIAVTGSIATDHLMTFPGRFVDQLLPDQLAHVSLSFLVSSLEVRRGGVAANIAYGLGGLGLTPVLAGAVGVDFQEYEVWLKEHGVDTSGVHVSDSCQTARFMCMTDEDSHQIASFYAGAMAEAAEIDLRTLTGPGDAPVDLVLVSPNDPAAMLRHTRQCRGLGIPFAADPSQQLARLCGHEARELVKGARWLFTNESESALLRERTCWDAGQILDRVGIWVTTLGAEGVRIERKGEAALTVPAVPGLRPKSPTGVGDAFRAGFLAAVSWYLPLETAAQLGCAMAALALEAVGSQDYEVDPEQLLATVTTAYGPDSARLLGPALRALT